jgi:hypothetical protein
VINGAELGWENHDLILTTAIEKRFKSFDGSNWLDTDGKKNHKYKGLSLFTCSFIEQPPSFSLIFLRRLNLLIFGIYIFFKYGRVWEVFMPSKVDISEGSKVWICQFNEVHNMKILQQRKKFGWVSMILILEWFKSIKATLMG